MYYFIYYVVLAHFSFTRNIPPIVCSQQYKFPPFLGCSVKGFHCLRLFKIFRCLSTSGTTAGEL